jgi:hypothetical protein
MRSVFGNFMGARLNGGTYMGLEGGGYMGAHGLYKNNKILMYIIHYYAEVSSHLDCLQAASSMNLRGTAGPGQALELDCKMRSR